MTNESFVELYQQLMQQNFMKPRKSAIKSAVPGALEKLITSGDRLLPMTFRKAYSHPLSAHLEALLQRLTGPNGQVDPTSLETMLGAVYEHADKNQRPELHRFLAVISNMYRSFLDKTKREALDIRLTETLPPLAVFQSDPGGGPFTMTVETVQSLIGGTVGVVSLPYTFADHPLLYGSLAHETGGHDVIHADPTLMPQLRQQVYTLFTEPTDQWLGVLWDYWMDEAAADVYGVLNVGPTFGANLALLLAVFIAQAEKQPAKSPPSLRTETGGDDDGLDPHPTDILRLGIVQGVVENLVNLSSSTRQSYIDQLASLAQTLAPGATQVAISGTVRVQNGRSVDIQRAAPLEFMQAAAKKVGAMIATTSFAALGGKSIQEVETWDDADENAAVAVAGRLATGTDVSSLGDDAQLIAGLTLACLHDPTRYAAASAIVVNALDDSFASDPYWGVQKQDRFVVRPTRTYAQQAEQTDPIAAELIDYNPLEEDAALAPGAFGAAMVSRHAIAPIPWPKGLGPEPDKTFVFKGPDAELPRADFVIITWTAAEANAMSAVMTPGAWAMPPSKYTGPAWHEYTNQWSAKFASRSSGRAPAAQYHYIGKYMPVLIGGKRVLLFKSNFHLARDDESMPVKDMFKQIIEQTHAKLVITTGTAGAIGSKLKLGDAVIASDAYFHCGRKFKNAPFNMKPVPTSPYQATASGHLSKAGALIQANAGQLRSQRKGAPSILTKKAQTGEPIVIVTTDEFEYDEKTDHFKLQGRGSMVEMDDAVLGLAIKEMRSPAAWLAIRNASDPQMANTSKPQRNKAADIYKQYGYWTSIPSAIASWAMVLDF